MNNLPQILQTPADFALAESMVASGTVQASELVRHYQGLLSDRYTYQFSSVLAAGATPPVSVQTPPEWWIEQGGLASDGSAAPARVLARTDNPAARALGLGLSWDAIAKRITQLGAE